MTDIERTNRGVQRAPRDGLMKRVASAVLSGIAVEHAWADTHLRKIADIAGSHLGNGQVSWAEVAAFYDQNGNGLSISDIYDSSAHVKPIIKAGPPLAAGGVYRMHMDRKSLYYAIQRLLSQHDYGDSGSQMPLIVDIDNRQYAVRRVTRGRNGDPVLDLEAWKDALY